MNNSQTIQMINIDSIIPNRFQPRLTFDDQGINELASSIKEHGIIQPIVLRKLGDKYEIIAGERRYKASALAGLTEIPAIISNMDDNQSAEVALVENVQRRNLTSIEEAKSYKKILDKGYLTQETLAKKMGVSQSTVANKLRLLNLSIPVQEALLNERISERHARSLLQITDENLQQTILNRVTNERLTVRQLDLIIKELDEKKEMNPSFEEINFSPKQDEILITEEPIKINSQINNDFQEETITENIDIKNNDEVNMETLEQIDETSDLINEDISKSKLLNIFDKPSFPSLEDEKVNLSFEFSSDNIFDEEIIPEKLEEPEKIIEEIKPEIIEEKSRIIANKIESITTAIKELETEIKEAGFKITSEEFDFEDLYQIIIKIDKQAN